MNLKPINQKSNSNIWIGIVCIFLAVILIVGMISVKNHVKSYKVYEKTNSSIAPVDKIIYYSPDFINLTRQEETNNLAKNNNQTLKVWCESQRKGNYSESGEILSCSYMKINEYDVSAFNNPEYNQTQIQGFLSSLNCTKKVKEECVNWELGRYLIIFD